MPRRSPPVRGETGSVSAPQNIQVELFPAYESYADALRRLTEKQAPAPLATARVGAGGTYEVLAPEKGCFRVVVRADGHLPVRSRSCRWSTTRSCPRPH